MAAGAILFHARKMLIFRLETFCYLMALEWKLKECGLFRRWCALSSRPEMYVLLPSKGGICVLVSWGNAFKVLNGLV